MHRLASGLGALLLGALAFAPCRPRRARAGATGGPAGARSRADARARDAVRGRVARAALGRSCARRNRGRTRDARADRRRLRGAPLRAALGHRRRAFDQGRGGDDGDRSRRGLGPRRHRLRFAAAGAGAHSRRHGCRRPPALARRREVRGARARRPRRSLRSSRSGSTSGRGPSTSISCCPPSPRPTSPTPRCAGCTRSMPGSNGCARPISRCASPHPSRVTWCRRARASPRRGAPARCHRAAQARARRAGGERRRLR